MHDIQEYFGLNYNQSLYKPDQSVKLKENKSLRKVAVANVEENDLSDNKKSKFVVVH